MLNPRMNTTPVPCKQRDVDICAALMGKPVGETKLDDLHELETPPTEPAAPIELAQLFVLPKNREAMKLMVKQVQSRVVQVSGTVREKAVVAGGHMRVKMASLNEQVKQRMADSAAQTAKRMKKAS